MNRLGLGGLGGDIGDAVSVADGASTVPLSFPFPINSAGDGLMICSLLMLTSSLLWPALLLPNV